MTPKPLQNKFNFIHLNHTTKCTAMKVIFTQQLMDECQVSLFFFFSQLKTNNNN